MYAIRSYYVEDRDELVNSFDPDNIDLEVVQATDGRNNFV